VHHLLDLESAEITPALIESLFAAADRYADQKSGDQLRGKVVANLFFEPSTRTRISFGRAARRLGADVIDFSPGGSSTSKGETFIDTARNIEAMGVDIVVVRHTCPGTPHLLARDGVFRNRVSVVNAGDGPHEHPTQGLLDIYTIRKERGSVKGLTVALVGDILHSRVARSNIHGLTKLGAHVICCGPTTLVPPEIAALGVEIAHDLDAILPRCDVVNLLRVQFERQRSAFFPSVREYAQLFGMNGDRLKRAKPDCLILAPGPINRGVELTPDVADDEERSLILDQVTNGLAVRMAVLAAVAGSSSL
jgi:aspartate carbamoyltransferase catalytic subunit